MKKNPSKEKLDKLVEKNIQNQLIRAGTYRERALKMYSWVCANCGREFNQKNISELTVHHRDFNHDNNPEDGSNWELLCLYCHDNVHQRHTEAFGIDNTQCDSAVSKPFMNLKTLMKKNE